MATAGSTSTTRLDLIGRAAARSASEPLRSKSRGAPKNTPGGQARRVWSQLLVSRVLLRASVALSPLAVIPLGRSLPSASCGLPRDSGRQPSNVPLHGLAPDGVCLATTVTGRAVGSYPTFSPLPEAPKRLGRSNSLWHFPRGFPHRALPGILPCGARTFLADLGLADPRDRLRCCGKARLIAAPRSWLAKAARGRWRRWRH